MKDKIRIYVLARELDIESKDLVDLCKKAGFDVKSQLSSIDPDQRDMIVKMLQTKSTAPPAAPPPPPAAPAAARPPVIPSRPPTLAAPRGPVKPLTTPAAPAPTPAAPEIEPAPAVSTPEEPPPTTPAVPPATTASLPTAPPAPPPLAPRPPPELAPKVRNLDQLTRRPVTLPPSTAASTSATAAEAKPGEKRSDRPRTAGPNVVVATSSVKRKPGPAPMGKADEKKPEGGAAAHKPLMKLTPEMLQSTSGGVNVKEVLRKIEEKVRSEQLGARPLTPIGTEDDAEDEEAAERRRAGGVSGRDERHRKRSARAKTRQSETDTDLRRIALDDEDEGSIRSRLHRMRQHRPGTLPRKGDKVELEPPITVRSMSEALGVRASDILRKLMERKLMVTINSDLSTDLAEEIAIELGREIFIKSPQDDEDKLMASYAVEDDPAARQPRAPVVTVMGHVDHGKTSLLDRIRESNVVATEAGGITQHLRAWRVEHNGRPITFLDTPGHEAFTQMRARGANVTDIVVLVVAADDGVMPQTDEAISHAKAANVPIIVAINKVDLPNANLTKTKNMLMNKGLVPDDMGGDTPFIETVSVKDRARGINELLDMISLVAEMKELRANPTKPASGVCLEALISGDEGVTATLLVQDGTLRRGDVLLCGAAYGRVRAMYSDLGKPLEEAGPTLPVRVLGLDTPPNADDKFFVVPDVAQAREIAEVRQDRQRLAQPIKKSVFRLEDLDKAKVVEIKLILKADVRGSIEAINKELLKLEHEEVKLKVLHTGVGAITEGDVQLALASPEDTLIVGFNVVPDDRARSLADEKGVQVRLYNIIYQLTDDLRAALEGKLKPSEQVVNLGRAVVRQLFKISRVGTVAGCHVTQGTIERSARIRLIREGVVIYPPPEKVATLDSLKRIKDDVREVREGYECGIKIAGYDDLKIDDVIEAYKVVQVQRTL